MFKNQKILITGGTGFLTEALIPKLIKEECSLIRIAARNEGRLVRIKEKYPQVEIVIADICDAYNCERICKDMDGIIHTAAQKSVTLAEENVKECIETNINGTINMLEATRIFKPKFIIGISTDKAESKRGVYGCTKYLMEQLFSEYKEVNEDTVYQIIRLGNIWGSTGSIGVKWPEKIKKGELIEVSDPEATRFWLSVEEALEIIDEALTKAIEDDQFLYIPKLKAANLRTVLIALSDEKGYRSHITGLREGENKHETLDGKIYSNEVKQYTIKEFKEKFLK